MFTIVFVVLFLHEGFKYLQISPIYLRVLIAVESKQTLWLIDNMHHQGWAQTPWLIDNMHHQGWVQTLPTPTNVVGRQDCVDSYMLYTAIIGVEN